MAGTAETADPRPDAGLETFIHKAVASGGAERANYQLFIVDLCQVLGLPRLDYSREDTAFDDYVFERRVTFHHPDGSTTTGFIDCYRRGCFVLEAKQSRKRPKADDAAQLSLLGGEEHSRKSGSGVRGGRSWDRVMIEARRQAENYARALPVDHGYPPFLLVVDVGNVIEVFADFSGQGKNYAHFPDRQTYRIDMDDLREAKVQDRLRRIWLDPLSLDPTRRTAAVTRDIADRLARIARRLEAKHDAKDVAEFLMRCVFTMFAEDVGLLPDKGFARLLDEMRRTPGNFVPALENLWRVMDEGGYAPALNATLRRFNGVLFKDRRALPLSADDIGELSIAAQRDWQDVEPAIFGTLLERALEDRERAKLGAHYTPRAYVERLVVPTIIEPLRDDWSDVHTRIRRLVDEGKQRDALNAARAFHRQLCTTRVLDPACGTGNFLYVALEMMKRLEGEALETIAGLGGEPDRYADFPEDAGRDLVGQKLVRTGGRFTVDPHQFHGLELNPRAVPIADLVLWIGFIKWQLRTGADVAEPVLDAYGTIRQQDAILAHDGQVPALDDDGNPRTRWDGHTTKLHPITGERIPDPDATVPIMTYRNPRRAPWPEVEFVIGNPPFIGGKDMRAELGDGYAEAAWAIRPNVPGGADFVMHFWDEAARRLTAKTDSGGRRLNPLRRFGFITTNSITQTFSRRVIERRPKAEAPFGLIFAVPDHPWLKASDKAAVRIAMTVAEAGAREGVLAEVLAEAGLDTDTPQVTLDRREGTILPNLTIGADTSRLVPLWACTGLAHMGYKLHGDGFILKPSERVPEQERRFVRPYLIGRELMQKCRGYSVIDLFGLSAEEASKVAPFLYSRLHDRVKPARDENARDVYRLNWWVWGEPRRELRDALRGQDRQIVTTRQGAHRVFQRNEARVAAESTIVVIAMAEPWMLTTLSSRLHTVFSLATGGWLGVGNDTRYLHSSTFNTFPFPVFDELSGLLRERLSSLGERLDAFRQERLAAYPHLTMTGLYNALERARELASGADVAPISDAERDIHEAGCIAILAELHDDIDRAVFCAYGWAELAPALIGRPGATAASPHKSAEQEQAEEELLIRLVDLNRARAAEEARGMIQWLRPEYQVPKLRAKAPKPSTAEQAEAVLEPVEEREKPTWPADGLEQIRAVRRLLSAAPAPVSPADVAARFKGGRRRSERIRLVLEDMTEMGVVAEAGQEPNRRFFLPS